MTQQVCLLCKPDGSKFHPQTQMKAEGENELRTHNNSNRHFFFSYFQKGLASQA